MTEADLDRLKMALQVLSGPWEGERMGQNDMCDAYTALVRVYLEFRWEDFGQAKARLGLEEE